MFPVLFTTSSDICGIIDSNLIHTHSSIYFSPSCEATFFISSSVAGSVRNSVSASEISSGSSGAAASSILKTQLSDLMGLLRSCTIFGSYDEGIMYQPSIKTPSSLACISRPTFSWSSRLYISSGRLDSSSR